MYIQINELLSNEDLVLENLTTIKTIFLLFAEHLPKNLLKPLILKNIMWHREHAQQYCGNYVWCPMSTRLTYQGHHYILPCTMHSCT